MAADFAGFGLPRLVGVALVFDAMLGPTVIRGVGMMVGERLNEELRGFLTEYLESLPPAVRRENSGTV